MQRDTTNSVEWEKWKNASFYALSTFATRSPHNSLVFSANSNNSCLHFLIWSHFCALSNVGVGAPLHFKLGKPYCPVKACYKYQMAKPCPRNEYASTHECEVAAYKRKSWSCMSGRGHGRYVTESGETVSICQCVSKVVSTPMLIPVSEYSPTCKK